MKINEEGLRLIKHFEGFSERIYICPAGKRTIGFGHALLKNEKFPEIISKEEAEEILRVDLEKFEDAVERMIAYRINQNQFSALTSFCFNVGVAAFQRSTIRRKINSGYIKCAGEEFLRWVFVNGKRYPGIYRRRMAEKQLFESVL